MGGSSYDRDVYSESSSSSWGRAYSPSKFGISKESEYEMGQNQIMNESLSPIGKKIVSHTKTPIIVVLDVTGSNIDFAKVVYDKMPMFYGQIEQQGYLDDFDICFCAVGDCLYDRYPIQIGNFAKGIEIDKWLKLVVLEGYGGHFGQESYEAMAYYLLKNFEFDEGANPIVFFIGDEDCYPKLEKRDCEALGIPYEYIGKENIFKELREKLNDNVFMLLNKAFGHTWVQDIIDSWNRLLPNQHTILIHEEKSIVDLMLGIIALCNGTRTLKGYINDLENRNQTEVRRENVEKSLNDLSKEYIPTIVVGEIPKSEKTQKSTGKRL